MTRRIHGTAFSVPTCWSAWVFIVIYLMHLSSNCALKAFKHVFTSPSSVDKEPKATRSGNARLHGMTRVTPGSIAYIATQVWPFRFSSGIPMTDLVSGALLIVCLSHFFSHRYHHGLWEVLYHHFGALIRSRWKTRSWCAFCLVEPVFKSISLNKRKLNTRISGRYFRPTRLPSALSLRIAHLQRSKRGGGRSCNPPLITPQPSNHGNHYILQTVQFMIYRKYASVLYPPLQCDIMLAYLL